VEKEYRVDTDDGEKGLGGQLNGRSQGLTGASETGDRRNQTRGATVTENQQHTKPILVLGGTGKSGRRVVQRLRARGLPVRVGSRSGAPPFDWEDRATWAPALAGTRAVYLTYYPDLAIPGGVEATRSFAELAVRSGVPRLALLSGRGEPEAERGEQAVRDTGAELTILRSSWFMQNFSEDYMLEHVLSGEIRLPAGDIPTPFLDADDIADVAVAALTDYRHVGQLYELTGPRLLTMAQVAAENLRGVGPRDPLRARLARAARGRGRRARRPARVRGVADLLVRRGRGRPQRRHNRRCPTGARPRAAGLRRLRAERRGDGRLGLGHRGRLSPASPANALVKTASS
jgi:nucleoside-diphosphate-sugar epimerase